LAALAVVFASVTVVEAALATVCARVEVLPNGFAKEAVNELVVVALPDEMLTCVGIAEGSSINLLKLWSTCRLTKLSTVLAKSSAL
jgi:hypothetical protein